MAHLRCYVIYNVKKVFMVVGTHDASGDGLSLVWTAKEDVWSCQMGNV